MEPTSEQDREAALRPLRNIGGVVSSLGAGSLPPEQQRSAVIQTASAVESTLRRVLRDVPGAAIEVRLKALAPDELRADEVLAELRQHERISMQLAAGVHDLLEVRRRLREGAEPRPEDARLAYDTAARVEREVAAPPMTTAATTAAAPPPVDATVLMVPGEEADAPPRDRRRLALLAGGIALLLLILVPLGVWLAGRGDSSGMDEGVALFRSGAYADAASHFFRYAQENPEDPTPHLYLARIHRRLKRYDLALPEIRVAMELAPEDADVHTELGLLLTDTGRFDTAIARFRQALRFDPASEGAWVGLVRALRAAGRPEAAETVLREAPPEIRAMLARPDVAEPTP